jgi:ATP phosphoribosyltransferase regulatory subunit
VRLLREQGETIVCMLPGHDEGQEFEFDRELVLVDGRWVLRAI